MQAGFVYYDQPGPNISPDISPTPDAFLDAGEPPIVFTLGSTAVHNPGNFFEVSAKAATTLRRRAILVGAQSAPGDPEILAVPYVPYSQVFPKAAAIVHQGGSGTTAQALRAGRPMLIVPYGWDQPDNGVRVQRLGAGLTVARAGYSAETAAAALNQLLTNPSFAQNAAQAAAQIRSEHAVTHAGDAIESALQR
jgi:UDP:flavonoid glycosyltransferase YjiC (YdhE family)